ncbi:MAG: adenosylcobinamide-GDP ribazoletransferase [Campylobacterota bacterium]|nr:adenosylcobinamide-GDP ribazoletransferase [Campylobacterota bacterium]
MVLKQSSSDKINGIVFAISYFSTIPLRTDSFEATKDFYKGVLYGLPIVGLLLAFLTIGLFLLLPYHPLYNAMLSGIFYLFLTGFLHFEALCDTIDGWYASYSNKDIYDVMHEPQVGSIGALGGVTFLILLLSSLVYALYLQAYWAVLISFILSRVSVFFALEFEFHEKSSFLRSLKESHSSSIVFDTVLYPLKKAVRYILSTLKKRLGFLNGDTIGAMIVIIEVILLNLMLLFA